MTKPRNYVVMTYARSGGTYLSQLLGSTGCLGRPEDWFNGTGYRNRGHSDYPLDRAGQLAMVLSGGRSPNGVTGVKLSPVRCDELAGFDWQSPLAPLSYIHLVREDRLGQAISDARAQQTGAYRSTTAPRAEPRYDARRIIGSLHNQLLDEARVRRFFAINGIAPLELTYEALLANEAAVLARIAVFLEVDDLAEPDGAKIELQMQRDAINEEWRARFLAEHGGALTLPSVLRPGWLTSLKRKMVG